MDFEVVPFVRIKDKKMYSSFDDSLVSAKDLAKEAKKDSMLYLLDLDGISFDRPNYELYQLLAEWFVLWIDMGPRVSGDVVDDVFAGAERVTVRPELFYDIDIDVVRQMTECPVFQFLEDEGVSALPHSEGFILPVGKNQEFKRDSLMSQLSLNRPVFVILENPSDVAHVKDLGCSGVLVEWEKKELFEGVL